MSCHLPRVLVGGKIRVVYPKRDIRYTPIYPQWDIDKTVFICYNIATGEGHGTLI